MCVLSRYATLAAIYYFVSKGHFSVGVTEYDVRLNHWWWYYFWHTLLLSVLFLLVELPCYYEIIVQKISIKFLALVVFLVTINGYIQTIVFYWRLHNPRIFYNPVVKGLFDLLLSFCVSTAIWYSWPKHLYWYNCLVFWFGST